MFLAGSKDVVYPLTEKFRLNEGIPEVQCGQMGQGRVF